MLIHVQRSQRFFTQLFYALLLITYMNYVNSMSLERFSAERNILDTKNSDKAELILEDNQQLTPFLPNNEQSNSDMYVLLPTIDKNTIDSDGISDETDMLMVESNEPISITVQTPLEQEELNTPQDEITIETTTFTNHENFNEKENEQMEEIINEIKNVVSTDLDESETQNTENIQENSEIVEPIIVEPLQVQTVEDQTVKSDINEMESVTKDIEENVENFTKIDSDVNLDENSSNNEETNIKIEEIVENSNEIQKIEENVTENSEQTTDIIKNEENEENNEENLTEKLNMESVTEVLKETETEMENLTLTEIVTDKIVEEESVDSTTTYNIEEIKTENKEKDEENEKEVEKIIEEIIKGEEIKSEELKEEEKNKAEELKEEENSIKEEALNEFNNLELEKTDEKEATNEINNLELEKTDEKETTNEINNLELEKNDEKEAIEEATNEINNLELEITDDKEAIEEPIKLQDQILNIPSNSEIDDSKDQAPELTTTTTTLIDSVINYVNTSFTNHKLNLQNKPTIVQDPIIDVKDTYKAALRSYEGAQVWRIVVQNDKERRMADELRIKYGEFN